MFHTTHEPRFDANSTPQATWPAHVPLFWQPSILHQVNNPTPAAKLNSTPTQVNAATGSTSATAPPPVNLPANLSVAPGPVGIVRRVWLLTTGWCTLLVLRHMVSNAPSYLQEIKHNPCNFRSYSLLCILLHFGPPTLYLCQRRTAKMSNTHPPCGAFPRAPEMGQRASTVTEAGFISPAMYRLPLCLPPISPSLTHPPSSSCHLGDCRSQQRLFSFLLFTVSFSSLIHPSSRSSCSFLSFGNHLDSLPC